MSMHQIIVVNKNATKINTKEGSNCFVTFVILGEMTSNEIQILAF